MGAGDANIPVVAPMTVCLPPTAIGVGITGSEIYELKIGLGQELRHLDLNRQRL